MCKQYYTAAGPHRVGEFYHDFLIITLNKITKNHSPVLND